MSNDIQTEPEIMPEKKKKTANKSNEEINAVKKKQAFVYLGPNLPGGILQTGGVYKEIPEHLKGIFEKIPELKGLFIEAKEVPIVKAELELQGSEAYRIYQSIVMAIEGGMINGL